MTATNGIDLNLVAAFARVVELGSFTAAAHALRLPKSSVSRAVSRLEESLGVRLLQRTTRRLGLTQAGERYIAEVRGPVARMAEASTEISDSGKEPRGLVRISIAPEKGDGWLSKLLVEFVRQYPKIRIEMVVTNRRVNLIEEAIDLALRAGKLDDSTLIARKVAIADSGLFAAPSYLERRGRPRRLSDLTAHDCVLHKGADGIVPWRLSGPRGVERVEVSGPISADDLGSVRSLTIAGLGIALLPDMLAQADVEEKALVRVLPAYSLRGTAVHLVSVPLRHVPTRVMLLRDYLLREIPARLAGTPCAPAAGARADARARSTSTSTSS